MSRILVRLDHLDRTQMHWGKMLRIADGMDYDLNDLFLPDKKAWLQGRDYSLTFEVFSIKRTINRTLATTNMGRLWLEFDDPADLLLFKLTF